MHRAVVALAALVCSTAAGLAAPAQPGRAEAMDYGPFLAATVDAGGRAPVVKGLVVRVGGHGEGSVLFDTQGLRYAAGWTGGWLKLHGPAFDGATGANPSAEGDLLFTSTAAPGQPGGRDPERHHRGLYRHGEQTVLSYTAGGTAVLELPGMEWVGQEPVFTRTIRLSASHRTLMLPVADEDGARPVQVFAADPLRVRHIDGELYVEFPARTAPTTYKIAICRQGTCSAGELARVTAAREDVAALCHGGPTMWGRPLETAGQLGKGEGPYVVDTLTAPSDNPFHSWLRFTGLDFFSDGRAALCTLSGDVWIVSGIDASSLSHLRWQRFATGLDQPMGLRIVKDEVYVLGRDQITRLHDLDGDGEADFYENFNNDARIPARDHAFAADLQTDSHGNFYYATATPVRTDGKGFDAITADSGSILQVSPDGKQLSVYASGLHAPGGLSVGPRDEISVSDTVGPWTPTGRIDFDVKRGDFLGVPAGPHATTQPAGPGTLLCWLPHDVDNAPGGQVWVTSDRWGPFTGEMLSLSAGQCTLFEMLKENVDGTWQGGIVRFPLTFATGALRGRFSDRDGQLYVAGMRGWQTSAAVDGALQRVRYTGKPVDLPRELHIRGDGIEIGFTAPLAPSIAADVQNYSIEEWNLIRSSSYGSAEMSVERPGEKGHDPVDVDSVTVAPDRRSIFLHVTGLKPVMQMHIAMKLKAADGTPLECSIYNTIQKVPGPAAPGATAAR